ncbi:MAG: tRNA (N(6)-L-threonylcarbamoyladenosine(37)-C(2))-methylthiotransferase MtaB [Geminicoccaceae bacterium]
MSKPDIITFGCRLNSFESEIIRGRAAQAGLDDVVVIHTCAVTAEAERQARQAIRRARRERPDVKIVVTGCSAQISPDRYAAMSEVDHVVGNQEKLDPHVWRDLSTQVLEGPRVMVGDVEDIRETAGHLIDGMDGRSRAFVQVQNGCDHRCTFCIIPYGRGPSRSVPVGEVVAQTRRLVEHGHKEVVLTGVDLTSYGKDLPGQPTLGQMTRRLLKLVPELPRLRLSSIDPAEVDPDLFELIASEPRLMPHLHLSVQAGDTLTLKRMKRRHTRDDVISLTRICKGLRPEIAFGADLITGFPTETEAMFENTLRLVEEAELTFLHVFPYSPREGTPAARMPQVPKAVAKERAARLRRAGEQALTRFLDREMSRSATLLVEQSQGGHTETFAPFRFGNPANAPAPGSLAPVVAERVEDGMLVGRLAA